MPTSASTSTKSKPTKSKSRKHKPVTSAESTTADPGKNGADPNWTFQPPPDAKLITSSEDHGEFDWDAVKDDEDIEMWLIRVPKDVKPKHLEGHSLDLSSSPKSRKTTSRIGSLKRKHNTYDIWSLGLDNDGQLLQEGSVVGGEELRSLSCLLPRKSKQGNLFPAPKSFSRHLIISAYPPQPTPTQSDTTPNAPSTTKHENPPREMYPSELLTHRFMPYGSLSNPDYVPMPADSSADEDAPLMVEVVSAVSPNMLPTPEPTLESAKKSQKDEPGVEGKVDSGKAEEIEEREKDRKKGKKRKVEVSEREEGNASLRKKSKKVKTR